MVFMAAGFIVGVRRTKDMIRKRLTELIQGGRLQIKSEGRELQLDGLMDLIVQ
jgi:hypothetical protein